MAKGKGKGGAHRDDSAVAKIAAAIKAAIISRQKPR